MPEAPYKQSRAALRERFGTRSIGYAGQSPLDSTPSGREKRAQEQGMSKAESVQYADQQFRDQFSPRQQIVPQVEPLRPMTRQSVQKPMFSGGLASPEDVGALVNQGAIGTVQTPYGTVTLPNTLPAEELAEFIPSTAGPLAGFGLPKPKPYLGSVMTRANRWRI